MLFLLLLLLFLTDKKAKVDTAGTKDIEGVVVTALGIKREKKSLGYATQEVKGRILAKIQQQTFLNVGQVKLQG